MIRTICHAIAPLREASRTTRSIRFFVEQNRNTFVFAVHLTLPRSALHGGLIPKGLEGKDDLRLVTKP